jgi:hypothetical protein
MALSPEDRKQLREQARALRAISSERLNFLEKKTEELYARADAVQRRIFVKVRAELEAKWGSGKAYAQVVSGLSSLERKIYEEDLLSFYQQLGRELQGQAALAGRYFKTLLGGTIKTYQDSALTTINKRIGMSGDKISTGGVFAGIARDLSNLSEVKRLATQSIASGQGFETMMRGLRDLYLRQGDGRLGKIERDIRTSVFDVYQQNDRLINKQIAEENGLKHYRYSAGTVESSREFCINRVGQVFTDKEIRSWSSFDWQGKSTPYDPFVDVGGYNCMHVLDPISQELYEESKGDG